MPGVQQLRGQQADRRVRSPLHFAACSPRSLPLGNLWGVWCFFPVPSAGVRSAAHKPPAQGAHISCLHFNPQFLARSYRKLAGILESSCALTRKPRSFPSKVSLATPRPQEVHSWWDTECEGGGASRGHTVWGPSQGDRKAPSLHRQDPDTTRERLGCRWVSCYVPDASTPPPPRPPTV